MFIIDSAANFYNNNSTVINTAVITTVVIVGVKVGYDLATKTVVFNNNTILALAKMTDEAYKNGDSGNLRRFLYELTMKGFKLGVKIDPAKAGKINTAEAVVTALHRICTYLELRACNLPVPEDSFQTALDLIAELADKAQAQKTAKKWWKPQTWSH